MSKRENIKIKTKYLTIEQCESSCIDIRGIKHLAKSWSSKLYGVIDNKHHFTISSEAKGAALFVFEGQVVEREDGIYMEGDIKVKPVSKKLVIASIILSIVIGILFLTTFNPVFMFMGMLFMVIPWINYIYMMTSDSLYQLIRKKVS